jgi:membrane protein implicated in regulation of membrane protease activity
MEHFLVWVIVGLLLVITELLTGTFYLLMLGLAGFGAGLAAWLGFDFAVQAIVFVAISGAGCYAVHAYRAKNQAQQMAPIDAGQPASFETWVDQAAGLARVRYRGASWEARVETRVEVEGALQPGAVVYVLATEGNTLRVSVRRSA